MRRLRTVLAAATVLLSPGLVACGDSESVSQEDLDPAAVIRQAAQESRASSFSFTMAGIQSGERASFEGEYQGGAVEAVHLRSIDEGGFEFLQIGLDGYFKVTDGGEMFPSGKWVKSPQDEADSGTGDLRDYFGALLAAGSVTDLGPEDVEGVGTRHYTGTVTVAALKAADLEERIRRDLLDDLRREKDGAADIEAWIDDEFQVRKFGMSGEYKKDAFNEAGPYEFTMTLRDFGKDFDIAAPPASEVMDMDAEPFDPGNYEPEGDGRFSDPKCQKAIERQFERMAEGNDQSAVPVLPKACR